MRLAIIAFTAGICLLQMLPALPPPWPALIPGALLLGLAPRFSGRPARMALILCGCFALGIGWAALRAEWRLAENLPVEHESRDIALTGIVAELPTRFTNGERFVFAVESVDDPKISLPHRLLLSRYARGEEATPPEPLRPGQRWHMTVRLKRPHGNANPHGFDYEAWLLERGIRATGYVRDRPAATLLTEQVARPAYLIERARHAIRERFLDTLADRPYGGILIALTIGDQRAIEGEFWQVFARTATTHLMSISGLHVTMIAALFGGMTGFLWRRSPRLPLLLPAQRAAILAGALAALAYAFLAGFSVPAQRTLYMLAVAALSLLSGRRTAPSQTLALALLTVLLLDPWAVLAAGFWLSFGAVALLFYIARSGAGETPGWRATLLRWSLAQWAITLGSLPLLLFFFQQFSLVSPLANAVAIPAISLLVAPLALLAALVPIPTLLHLDHWLLSQVMSFLRLLADQPMLEVPAPALWQVALAIPGLLWLLLPRGFPARLVGMALLLPALNIQAPRPPEGEVWLTVLDVGHGLAVAARTASKTLLYDTGPSYGPETDAGERVVLPYLRATGVRALDTLIVTHGDSDHAGGAASLMAALPIRRLLSSVPGWPGERCAAGQSWIWDDVRFTLLHPPEPVPDNASGTGKSRRKRNNHVCVLRVEAAGQAILLTSDIEAAEEKRLLAERGEQLRAEVLVVPHHGSRSSSTPAFVEAVGARHAIYSVGYRNRFGHPHPGILARYETARTWRTDRDGAIEIRLGRRLSVDAWRQQRPRYWHGR